MVHVGHPSALKIKVLFSWGQVYKHVGNMACARLLLGNIIHLDDATTFITALLLNITSGMMTW